MGKVGIIDEKTIKWVSKNITKCKKTAFGLHDFDVSYQDLCICTSFCYYGILFAPLTIMTSLMNGLS